MVAPAAGKHEHMVTEELPENPSKAFPAKQNMSPKTHVHKNPKNKIRKNRFVANTNFKTPELNEITPLVSDTVHVTGRTSWHPAGCPLYPSLDCFCIATIGPAHTHQTLSPDKTLTPILPATPIRVNLGLISIAIIGTLCGLFLAFFGDYFIGRRLSTSGYFAILFANESATNRPENDYLLKSANNICTKTYHTNHLCCISLCVQWVCGPAAKSVDNDIVDLGADVYGIIRGVIHSSFFRLPIMSLAQSQNGGTQQGG